ncbi:tRNA wybutosine-synthesizing protein 4-like, partial [Ascaphus truei]|uniref:tRNA wybutosine-synthesizing protein 4-like n=1 Tax=Ascaphus truei TaxID=8439 RepID=UPI003F5990FF
MHSLSLCLSQGWERCRVLDMNEFSLSLVPMRETLRIETLEPFDEFEELHLKCSHYFILVASRGSLAKTPILCPGSPGNAGFQVSPPPVSRGSLAISPFPATLRGIRRFRHRSCLLDSHLIITTGGFGEGDGKHQRLTDIHLLIREEECWKREETAGVWDGRLLHSLTPVSELGGLLVLGGRLSPSCAAVGALILRHNEETHRVTVTHRDLQPDLLRWRHSATAVTLC